MKIVHKHMHIHTHKHTHIYISVSKQLTTERPNSSPTICSPMSLIINRSDTNEMQSMDKLLREFRRNLHLKKKKNPCTTTHTFAAWANQCTPAAPALAAAFTDTQETERQRKRPALFHVETPAFCIVYTTHSLLTHHLLIGFSSQTIHRPHLDQKADFCSVFLSVFVDHLRAAFKAIRSHAIRHADHHVLFVVAIIEMLSIDRLCMMPIPLHKWPEKYKGNRRGTL